MVSGRVLVLHTGVVSGRPQKCAEVKWTVRDRVNVFTLRIASIRATLPSLDETEETTAALQSVAVIKEKIQAITSQTEDDMARNVIGDSESACARRPSWTGLEILSPMNGNIKSTIEQMTGYSHERDTSTRAPRGNSNHLNAS